MVQLFRKIFRISSVLCVVLSIFVEAGTLFAASSYSVISFRPPAAGSPYFGLFGSRPLAHKQFTFGLDTQYDYKPLDYVDVRGNKSNVIRHVILMQGSAALGLWNRFDFGVSFPAGYVNITPIGQTRRENRFRAGDAELEIRLGLLNADRYPVGVALVPFMTFPTGSTSSYLGSGSVKGGALAVLESDFLEKKLGLLLNLGYLFRNKDVKDEVTLNDQFLYGLGLHYRVIPELDLIAEVQGSAIASNMFKQTRQTPVVARAGVSITPQIKDQPARAYVGGGAGVIAGLGSPKAEVVAGGRYLSPAKVYVSGRAADKSATYEMAAKCMGVPKDMTGECFSYFELKEREAKCSGIVEDMTRVAKERCVAVWDLRDAEREIGAVVDLAVGCAASGAPEEDCMAYYDLEEKAKGCPTDYTSFDPWEHDPTCLRMLAVSRISSASAVEKPVAVVALPAAEIAKSAAPRRVETAREQTQMIAAEKVSLPREGVLVSSVRFKTASVLIEREYMEDLMGVAKYLKEHPEIEKLRIEGHADDVGLKSFNDKLSFKRAESVGRYLVKVGVSEGMLEAVGFGFERPLVEENTPQARAANRRVEFRVVNP